jgi:hypothetical protein
MELFVATSNIFCSEKSFSKELVNFDLGFPHKLFYTRPINMLWKMRADLGYYAVKMAECFLLG